MSVAQLLAKVSGILNYLLTATSVTRGWNLTQFGLSVTLDDYS